MNTETESPMTDVDMIVHARWVIPVDETIDTPILEQHCVVINDGIIVDICPQNAASRYRASKVIDRPNHALMPGLINTHGHIPMALFRGLADDLPLMEWLEQHIWPAEGQWVDERFVYDGARLAMAEMIRGGTTCFSDMYFFPEQTAKACIESGMRSQLTFPILDFPTAWAQNPDEYLHKGLALHDQYRQHDYVHIAFGPHAPYTVSDQPLRKIQTLADELGSPIQIHLHETAFEVSSSIEQHGVNPIQRLNQLGMLSPLLQAVHMTQLNDADIELMASNGCSVVHCPESNLKLASGTCPITKLNEAGVNVSLGTDGAASNNDLDMFAEMRTAALVAKAQSENASAIPAYEALKMATINGAKTLGLEKNTGSLENGKWADMIAVDMSAMHLQPIYNPISQLVYCANANDVSDVWVNGKSLLQDQQLQTLNTGEVISNAQTWRDKITNNH